MIELRKATAKAVRYACLHFHYAKSVPSVLYGYNVYQDGEWCGVILFGLGATPNIASPFGMIQGEVVELVRVALNGKQHATSECVAASLRQLHNDAPQIKIVVSYADADQNHTGIIYQATNWLYLGRQCEGDRAAFIVHGKKTHPRTIGSAGGVQSIKWVRENLDPNATEFFTKGKEKYIYVFNKRLRKEWMKHTKPYPKKEGSICQEDGAESSKTG